jgi:hypothetical protein
MKTVRYLFSLLLLSSLPLFSTVIPEANATPPSALIGDAAKSDNQQAQEEVGAVQEALGPFAKALSEDALGLVKELAKKYKSAEDFTKNVNFEELGKWGKGLETLGTVLDVTKYILHIAEVVDAYHSGDEARFINAVDDLTKDASIDLAKKIGETGGEWAGGAGGASAGPIGILVGKIGGGMLGEWLAEKAMEPLYNTLIKDTVRSKAGDLYHQLRGDTSPGDLLPGVTAPEGGGTSGPGSGGRRKGQLNPIKTVD